MNSENPLFSLRQETYESAHQRIRDSVDFIQTGQTSDAVVSLKDATVLTKRIRKTNKLTGKFVRGLARAGFTSDQVAQVYEYLTTELSVPVESFPVAVILPHNDFSNEPVEPYLLSGEHQLPKIVDQNILRTVFTHSSFLNETNEQITSNERLEFLGDSILSAIVTTHIYKRFPQLPEGQLTDLRSMLVDTDTLSAIAKLLDLGKYLRLSKGEDLSGRREGKRILANTLEAFIGGLFMDQGMEAATAFVENVLLKGIGSIVQERGVASSKSRLQEISQASSKETPVYRLLEEEGMDHDKKYTVGVYISGKLVGQGEARSKKQAEKNAAAQALQLL